MSQDFGGKGSRRTFAARLLREAESRIGGVSSLLASVAALPAGVLTATDRFPRLTAGGVLGTVTGTNIRDFVLGISAGTATIPENVTVQGTLTKTGTGTVTLNPTTAGTINNVSIGVTTAAAGRFTTLTATGNAAIGDATTDAHTLSGSLTATGPASTTVPAYTFQAADVFNNVLVARFTNTAISGKTLDLLVGGLGTNTIFRPGGGGIGGTPVVFEQGLVIEGGSTNLLVTKSPVLGVANPVMARFRHDASNYLDIEVNDVGQARYRLTGSVANEHQFDESVSALSLSSQNGLTVNTAQGDFDTRIYGLTDPDLFFVDASTDRVGIGTAVPAYKLDVDGSINAVTEYRVNGTKVVGAQGATVSDPTGGTVQDSEARTAIIAIIDRLQAHGLIA